MAPERDPAIIADYYRDMPIRWLRRKYGISEGVVYAALDRAGLPRRTCVKQHQIQTLNRAGLDLRLISRITRIDVREVCRHLRNAGTPAREAQRRRIAERRETVASFPDSWTAREISEATGIKEHNVRLDRKWLREKRSLSEGETKNSVGV